MNIGYIISIVLASLSVVVAGVAVFLFFKLKIKEIIDDLSGKSAQRSIQEMREANKNAYESGQGKSSAEARGLVTGQINADKSGKKHNFKTASSTSNSDSIQSQSSGGTVVLSHKDEDGTQVLKPGFTNNSADRNKNVAGFRIIQDITLIHTDEFI